MRYSYAFKTFVYYEFYYTQRHLKIILINFKMLSICAMIDLSYLTF